MFTFLFSIASVFVESTSAFSSPAVASASAVVSSPAVAAVVVRNAASLSSFPGAISAVGCTSSLDFSAIAISSFVVSSTLVSIASSTKAVLSATVSCAGPSFPATAFCTGVSLLSVVASSTIATGCTTSSAAFTLDGANRIPTPSRHDTTPMDNFRIPYF